MHLYAIASDIPQLDERSLRYALLTQGEDFALDPDTAWSVRSMSGHLVAAGVHHALELCGPRRYTSLAAARATWFDGLPVHEGGRVDARDAAALAGNWGALEHSLEGQFSAVDFDLSCGRVELQTDALGMCQVFCARRGRGVLVSNSSTLIASLLDLSAPDPLGVSSFLGIGWAMGASTMTRDLHVLPGGARHMIGGGSLATRRSFGPASVPLQTARRRSANDLTGDLKRLTANVVRGIEPISCGLTAGRDTRVLAALIQATGADVQYYTSGTEDLLDVIIARELARSHDLRHEVTWPDLASPALDWTEAAAVFMRQNDGLVSLLQLPDYIDLKGRKAPLGVKLWGVGGEIGMACRPALRSIATNVPLVRRSARAQRKLLSMKVRNEASIVTADALNELRRHLASFQAARLEEGWRPEQILEAFYAFERVGRWGATGPRRAAGADDIFSPFCSRPFVNYCFSLRSSERYVEAAHHRLLSELSPTLRDHRFEVPFKTPRPWLAPALASRELLRQTWQRLPGPVSARNSSSPGLSIKPTHPFQHAWLEQRLELVRELLCEPNSELWGFVSRQRIQSLLEGEEAARARHQEDLLRAVTLFWHFHGPPSSRPFTQPSSQAARAVPPVHRTEP